MLAYKCTSHKETGVQLGTLSFTAAVAIFTCSAVSDWGTAAWECCHDIIAFDTTAGAVENTPLQILKSCSFPVGAL